MDDDDYEYEQDLIEIDLFRGQCMLRGRKHSLDDEQSVDHPQLCKTRATVRQHATGCR